jgi:hypothetical protein
MRVRLQTLGNTLLNEHEPDVSGNAMPTSAGNNTNQTISIEANPCASAKSHVRARKTRAFYAMSSENSRQFFLTI